MKTSASEPRRVSVTLAKPHRHGGVDYAKGATIDVKPRQRAWLERQGVIAAGGGKKTGGD